MDVKNAVAIAKAYVADLFAEESVNTITIEEVAFNEQEDMWNVTLGFYRQVSPLSESEQWAKLPYSRAALDHLEKTYKTVQIKDSTGAVVALRHREI
ncbi:MAG: hypothetical protein FD149_2146 [Rhodospirillaceae bacterium]|nr:MAG: hypothetical protein FD149_2146 [Rhodospirillaceae bacterium]